MKQKTAQVVFFERLFWLREVFIWAPAPLYALVLSFWNGRGVLVLFWFFCLFALAPVLLRFFYFDEGEPQRRNSPLRAGRFHGRILFLCLQFVWVLLLIPIQPPYWFWIFVLALVFLFCPVFETEEGFYMPPGIWIFIFLVFLGVFIPREWLGFLSFYDPAPRLSFWGSSAAGFYPEAVLVTVVLQVGLRPGRYFSALCLLVAAGGLSWAVAGFEPVGSLLGLTAVVLFLPGRPLFSVWVRLVYGGIWFFVAGLGMLLFGGPESKEWVEDYVLFYSCGLVVAEIFVAVFFYVSKLSGNLDGNRAGRKSWLS